MGTRLGAALFFWSFPSKVYMTKRGKETRLRTETNRTTADIESADTEIQAFDASNPVTAEYEQTEQAYRSEIEQQQQIKTELESLKRQTKNSVADIGERLNKLEEGAERWGDNVMTIRSWMVNKKGIDARTVNKVLGVTEEFDEAVEKAKAL